MELVASKKAKILILEWYGEELAELRFEKYECYITLKTKNIGGIFKLIEDGKILEMAKQYAEKNDKDLAKLLGYDCIYYLRSKETGYQYIEHKDGMEVEDYNEICNAIASTLRELENILRKKKWEIEDAISEREQRKADGDKK